MLVDLGYEASLIAQWQAANVIYAEALPSSGQNAEQSQPAATAG